MKIGELYVFRFTPKGFEQTITIPETAVVDTDQWLAGAMKLVV